MTFSYRQTPNPQESEPQRSGEQQGLSYAALQGSEITGNPQPLPPSIRRKVLGNPSAGTAGKTQFKYIGEKRNQYSQNMTAPPAVSNNAMTLAQGPVPFMQFASPLNAQARQAVGANAGKLLERMPE